MARVNEVVREAIGDELERLSDPRRPAARDRLLFRARTS
jgi:hypothetical protein